MPDPDPTLLVRQIDSLRREVLALRSSLRRMQLSGVVALVAVSGLALGACRPGGPAAATPESKPTGPADVLEVRSFVLTGPDGKPAAVLDVDREADDRGGPGKVFGPLLRFLVAGEERARIGVDQFGGLVRFQDPGGQTRLDMSTSGETGLIVYDEKGKERINLSHHAGTGPGLILHDSRNRTRIQMFVMSDGQPHLEFLDREGRISYRAEGPAPDPR